MAASQARPKVKGKKRQKRDDMIDLSPDAAFNVANAKDKDFDLDLSNAHWQGKKGEAGSRSRSPKE